MWLLWELDMVETEFMESSGVLEAEAQFSNVFENFDTWEIKRFWNL